MDLIKLYYNTRKDAKGNLGIVLNVYKDRKERKRINSGISVKKSQWDAKKSLIKKSHPDHIELNSQLNQFFQKHKDFVDEMNRLHDGFNLALFSQFDDGSKSRECFIAYMENKLKKQDPKNGGDLTAGTIRKKQTHINNLKRIRSTIRFKDFNLRLLEEFSAFFSKEGMKKNSIKAQHSTFKSFVNLAIVDKFIKPENNPYLVFKPKGEEVIPTYLQPRELKLIEKYKPTNKTLEKVKDYFLFSCYTGLAYADYSSLSFEDIVMSDSKEYNIVRFRQKTGSYINLPISKLFIEPGKKSKPEVILVKYMEIFEKLKSRPKEERMFFKMSSEKINHYLKEIAKGSKVKVKLTTHVGRHTFGALLCNDLNVPITIVKELMAHSDITQTSKYVIANKQAINTMLLKTNWKEIY